MPDINKKNRLYKWRFGNIHYTVMGEGEPLLLVHGLGINRSMRIWRRAMLRLTKHYRVYAIDLLGFGKSDTPNLTYSTYLYTALLRDFITNVIKKETYIIAEGHSALYAINLSQLATNNTILQKSFLNASTEWPIKKIIAVNLTNQTHYYNKLTQWLLEWPLSKTIRRMILGRGYFNIPIHYDPSKIKIPVKYVRGKINLRNSLRFLRKQ